MCSCSLPLFMAPRPGFRNSLRRAWTPSLPSGACHFVSSRQSLFSAAWPVVLASRVPGCPPGDEQGGSKGRQSLQVRVDRLPRHHSRESLREPLGLVTGHLGRGWADGGGGVRRAAVHAGVVLRSVSTSAGYTASPGLGLLRAPESVLRRPGPTLCSHFCFMRFGL